VHEAIRRRYFSRRTEEAYAHWIRRFVFYSGRRHPASLGEVEVTAFLNHLAAERRVAASTQNQALSALLFLYKEVLGRELAWLDGLQRATRSAAPAVVLTREEVEAGARRAGGGALPVASLLYGAGLRVMESCPAVKDVDLGYRQILVRDGKGGEVSRDDDAGEARAAASPARLARGSRCTHAISRRDMARCACHTRSRAVSRAVASGSGNTCFRPVTAPPDPEDGGDTTPSSLDSVAQRAIREAAHAAQSPSA